MKLIREIINEFKPVTEAAGPDGTARLYIEGIFLQSELVNGNGRKYPETVMDKAVAKYQAEYISQDRALGELNHPDSPQINYERACIKTVSLTKDGTNYIGKAMVLSGGLGPLIASLVADKVKIGVSSRGLASVHEEDGVEVVDDDFTICAAADVVSDPSAPDAFVKGVLERKDFVIENGIIVERKLVKVERAIKKAGRSSIKEVYLRAAAELLKKI